MRRRTQFTVRTVLIATAVTTIPLAYLAWKCEQKRNERQVVSKISLTGGKIHYDWELRGGPREPWGWRWCRACLGDDFFANITGVHLGPKTTDVEVSIVSRLRSVVWIDVQSDQVTDAGLQSVKELKGLERVTLACSLITDDGISQLAGLPHLVALEISNAGVTGAGFMCLEGFPSLERIYLHDTCINDAGLSCLERMPRLKELVLINSPVSDVGLSHIRNITTLKMLYLHRTDVTDSGIRDFQRSLPHCTVFRNGERMAVGQ